ncbi:putative secreted protein [Corynebacterium diphtheriae BH8]|nr:putative secreted protein [Corynebacterium diphtheriae BH8]
MRMVASALICNSAWIDLGAGVIFLIIGVIMAVEGVAGIVG